MGLKASETAGFTLIEMMVALVIVAILIAIGAPGLSDLIKNNRMVSQVYGIRATLNGARSEALAQRSFVTVCRSEDGVSCSGDWNQGYIAFVDADGDGVVDDPNSPAGDQVFLAKVVDDDRLGISFSKDSADPVAGRVRFDSQGYARIFNGTFTVCDDRGSEDARGVIVTPVGIVRAMDPNEPVACL